MKTRQEVEQIKIKIQKNIDYYRDKAQDAYRIGDNEAFIYYDRQYAKSIAQHNILLEILQ